MDTCCMVPCFHVSTNFLNLLGHAGRETLRHAQSTKFVIVKVYMYSEKRYGFLR